MLKFWFRWIANGIAVFLALYLVDSLLPEHFRFTATWAAVLAAIVLGLLNSFIRPLHRARSKPARAALVTVLTILVNTLILQLFVWVGADLTSSGYQWVLLAAAFVTMVTALINAQVGFAQTGKPRPSERRKPADSDGGRPARGRPV